VAVCPQFAVVDAQTVSTTVRRRVILLALLVGPVGGIYGIGGGSILGPILVGTGVSVATVALAALASTFATMPTGSGWVAQMYTPGRLERWDQAAPAWGYLSRRPNSASPSAARLTRNRR
jgi:hypothetical protein